MIARTPAIVVYAVVSSIGSSAVLLLASVQELLPAGIAGATTLVGLVALVIRVATDSRSQQRVGDSLMKQIAELASENKELRDRIDRLLDQRMKQLDALDDAAQRHEIERRRTDPQP